MHTQEPTAQHQQWGRWNNLIQAVYFCFGSNRCDSLALKEERDCKLAAAQTIFAQFEPHRAQNQPHHINDRSFARIWKTQPRHVYGESDGAHFDSMDKLQLLRRNGKRVRREGRTTSVGSRCKGDEKGHTDIHQRNRASSSLACRSATVHIIMPSSLLF